jgi:hypothetical protein
VSDLSPNKTFYDRTHLKNLCKYNSCRSRKKTFCIHTLHALQITLHYRCDARFRQHKTNAMRMTQRSAPVVRYKVVCVSSLSKMRAAISFAASPSHALATIALLLRSQHDRRHDRNANMKRVPSWRQAPSIQNGSENNCRSDLATHCRTTICNIRDCADIIVCFTTFKQEPLRDVVDSRSRHTTMRGAIANLKNDSITPHFARAASSLQRSQSCATGSHRVAVGKSKISEPVPLSHRC